MAKTCGNIQRFRADTVVRQVIFYFLSSSPSVGPRKICSFHLSFIHFSIVSLLSFFANFHCQHKYPSSTKDVSPQSVLHGDVVSGRHKGGIAGFGLGHLLGESMLQLPRVGWNSPVKTEPPQTGLLLSSSSLLCMLSSSSLSVVVVRRCRIKTVYVHTSDVPIVHLYMQIILPHQDQRRPLLEMRNC